MRGVRLAGVVMAMLVAGCGKREEPAKSQAVRVGLVFDIGGRGDKSFNDSAYRGLERARQDLGVEVQFHEPAEGADRETGLREYASRGFDLVIGVGFMFSDDIEKIAREFETVKFACVDFTVPPAGGGGAAMPPNLVALKFREEEGSFLAGATAALVSQTGKVGFVGGMDIPLIHKFEAGYRAGARHVRPSVEVLAGYAGVTAAAFKDPAKGKEMATGMYDRGADVIFHASGTTGLGVFEAARDKGKLAIGVDSDQFDEAPGVVLTSMVKDVDVAVFGVIQDVKRGSFQGGIRELGLRENGVRLVRDARNATIFPEPVFARVEILRDSIASGQIAVPRQ